MPKSARRDIVFLHVPKTGGTAVRNALVRAAGARAVLYDYGGHSEETSPQIRAALYADGVDAAGVVPDDLRDRLEAPHGVLLSGHFQAAKYWGQFHPESFVTFLRDPVDRIVSEYNHLVRHRGLEQTLDDFVSRSRHRRHLTYLFRDVDPLAFGFVGFTDSFEADITALARIVGAPLAVARENEGSYDPALVERLADPDYREWIRRKLGNDAKLYRALKNRFAHQRAQREARLAGSRAYAGRVRLAPGGRLVGFAVHRRVEAIVDIEIAVGDTVAARLPADLCRPYLKALGLSRTGVGAFSVALRPLLRAAGVRGPRPSVTVRVAGTGIELAGSPVTVRRRLF